MPTCTIYKITNLVNGKRYVGQTWKTLLHRMRLHINDANSGYGHCKKLVRAVRKYGSVNFVIEALATVTTQLEADALEASFITSLDTIRTGYNLRHGGTNGALSETTKARMRKAHTGKTITPETRAKIAATLTGRKIGTPSDATRKKIAEAHRGRRASPETKTKLSNAHRGKPLSPEHRAAQSLGKLGHPVSDEQKLKQSLAMRLVWQRRKALVQP